MTMTTRKRIGTGIAVGAAALLTATTVAVASPESSADTTPDPSTSATPGDGSGGGHRGYRGGSGETLLSGSDAAKATAAAEAAVPGGTVMRVETDADGVYEAHVRKSDGTGVLVTMDENFTVTGIEEFTGHGGHHGFRGGSGETLMTGSDAEKATAAAEAAVPGGTVVRVETDEDGVYEAHVRRSDGTPVLVTMDESFTVTGVEECDGPGAGTGGPHHQRPWSDDDADEGASTPTASPSA